MDTRILAIALAFCCIVASAPVYGNLFNGLNQYDNSGYVNYNNQQHQATSGTNYNTTMPYSQVSNGYYQSPKHYQGQYQYNPAPTYNSQQYWPTNYNQGPWAQQNQHSYGSSWPYPKNVPFYYQQQHPFDKYNFNQQSQFDPYGPYKPYTYRRYPTPSFNMSWQTQGNGFSAFSSTNGSQMSSGFSSPGFSYQFGMNTGQPFYYDPYRMSQNQNQHQYNPYVQQQYRPYMQY